MSFLINLFHIAFVGLVYITMLLVLVAAHEFGHYLFARLFGMGAEEFALGMGGKPWILGRRRYLIPILPFQDPEKRGGTNRLESGDATEPAEIVQTPSGAALRETTLFTVRPWPLGGFVRIKGMMPEEDGSETQIPGGFFSKAPWKRWVVLAAGPAFSVLAGILILIPVFTFYGLPTPTDRPVIEYVLDDGAARREGLQAGDRIVSVDGVATPTWFDVVSNVRDKGVKPLAIVVERAGKRIEKQVKGELSKDPVPVATKTEDETPPPDRIQTRLGIAPEMETKPVSLQKAVVAAVRYPYVSTADLISRFRRPKELAESVGGPGTMIKVTSDSVDEGAWAVVRLAGLLSISVGIFNLLPFPPLDGGQMWIAFVEMLRGGRRLSMRTQLRLLNFGAAMVVLLIATVLVIDFRRLTGLSGESKIESAAKK